MCIEDFRFVSLSMICAFILFDMYERDINKVTLWECFALGLSIGCVLGELFL